MNRREKIRRGLERLDDAGPGSQAPIERFEVLAGAIRRAVRQAETEEAEVSYPFAYVFGALCAEAGLFGEESEALTDRLNMVQRRSRCP